MKKIVLLSTMMFLVLFGTLKAQDMTEGYIKMELTEVTSDSAQIAMALEMMKGMSIETYFTSKQALTIVNMMGGMMETKTLINNETNEMLMLFDMSMMGQKILVRDKTNNNLKQLKSKEQFPGVKITSFKSDTKVIAGYSCYRIDIAMEDQKELKMSAYISEEIKASYDKLKGFEDMKLDGFPLEYTLSMGDLMTMTYTTIELKQKVDPSIFNLDTTGYNEMSMEEFQNSMGGLNGGGMGF